MRITGLEAIPIEMAFKSREESGGLGSYARHGSSRQVQPRVLVRIATDEGITGWGELFPVVGTARGTRVLFEELIEPHLVGESVWEIESFLEERREAAPAYAPETVEAFLGGVEMAMLDAWGKHLGVPVHQLLGGKCSDTVEFAFALGIMSPEESREHAQWAYKNGFTTLKTKAGVDWRQDVERIVAMDDETDGNLDFRLDPNQGYTLEDAVRVAASLEDEGVYLQYLEQPVRIDSFGTYKRLRERVQTPIATNEDLYMNHNLHHLVKEDAIDVGVIELVAAGGILRMKQLAGVAADAGISLSHHSGRDLGVKTAAVLHAVSSTPAVNLPPDTVYYAYEDDIIESPFQFEDGALPVPDDPGLGVTVDEHKVESYRVEDYSMDWNG
jgi:L-alanine-DL-glutamate epimerase-like enolase superfamily enzyme